MYVCSNKDKNQRQRDDMGGGGEGGGLVFCVFGGFVSSIPYDEKTKKKRRLFSKSKNCLKTCSFFFFRNVPDNFRLVEFPLPRAKLSAPFLPILGKEPQLLLSLYIRAAYGAEGYGRRDARHPFPSFLSIFLLPSFLPSSLGPSTTNTLIIFFSGLFPRYVCDSCAKRVGNRYENYRKIAPAAQKT
jgi:hypothetical protein